MRANASPMPQGATAPDLANGLPALPSTARPDARDTWRENTFLLGPRLDAAMLAAAMTKAAHLDVAPHKVLIADGIVTAQEYVEAVASHLGVDVVRPGRRFVAPLILIDGTRLRPAELAELVHDHHLQGQAIALVTPQTLEDQEDGHVRSARLQRAVRGLRRLDPALSAAAPIRQWQILAFVMTIGVAIGSGSVAPGPTRAALLIAIGIPFFCVVLFRLIVLGSVLFDRPRPAGVVRERLSDGELPAYAVLVPLFRETAILPDLVDALSRIDYPAVKLDCILVLEASDRDTVAVARALALPPFMRIVVVPDGTPRTKPKALNYALQVAHGDYVAVFDAEDVPDPQQLRMAVHTFASGDARLMCVQASLAIHNARASWITRQFALEYAALFEGLLPALARFQLPVPLGGTSNHFRRSFLDAAGGWDPHNVTEDADLGIRIARAGGLVATIPSTTWEEAPTRLRPWIGQRTRWMKGWMQTYLVHTRHPIRLYRDLGLLRCLAFHLLIGGVILSSLVHPLVYLWIAWELWSGDYFATPSDALDRTFAWFALFNLLVGYGGAMAVGAIAATRSGAAGLAPHALLMPLYWLLISVAAWRAVVQLAVAPYYWEKTEHAARRRPPG